MAQTEEVLYNFCTFSECADGQYPEVQLIQDSQGNFYGTTYEGGAHNGGTVFKLAPEGDLTVLYSFGATSADGIEPTGRLVRDSKGNLYGATGLDSAGNETILHSFGSGTDGSFPHAALLMDSAGNLYGTTEQGGTSNGGTVFEVMP